MARKSHQPRSYQVGPKAQQCSEPEFTTTRPESVEKRGTSWEQMTKAVN